MKNKTEILISKNAAEQISFQAGNEKEFFGFLVGKIKKESVIVDGVAFNPYVASYDQAISLGFMGTHRKDFIGTIHTHPGNDSAENIRPSTADLRTFTNFSINIIANKNGMNVFDSSGNSLEYEISKEKISKSDEDKIEKIQNEIMEDAIKEEQEQDERKEKIKHHIMTILKILFVIFVISSLVFWYFI